jgi:uncharacterized protein (DUF488 family)
VWTVGHSNRPLVGFLDLLRVHAVDRLVDVRRYPGSRRHPHFSRGPLAEALAGAGIDYEHMPDLGGHRSPSDDSLNTAWPAETFRGYADHMETEAYAAALAQLRRRAMELRTVAMCAEADWRGCHRNLLSDRLVVEGVRVLHITGAGDPVEHPLTPQARVMNGRLSYRAPVQGRLPGFD